MRVQDRARDLPPNILWICTDQQRHDTIHALGNESIHSPQLDRLCRTGVAFTRAYCQNPVCTPSRASFLTGRYPSSIHVNTNGNAFFPEGVPLISGLLAERGYRCGLSGKLHLASAWMGRERRTDDGYAEFHYSHDPFHGAGRGGRIAEIGGTDGTGGCNDYLDWLRNQGVGPEDVFERIALNPSDFQSLGAEYRGYKPDIPARLHQTVWCTDRAADFISRGGDQAWFFSLNVFDPHPPFDAPDEYRLRYPQDRLTPPLFRESDLAAYEYLSGVYFQSCARRPGEREMRNLASYYGMMELIDDQVGRLLDLLESSGQRENTLVIFGSDHGEMLGDHGLTGKGCRFYEGAVHVPLIMSWPGHFREGVKCGELVELTDIAPTLAELAGLSMSEVHGRSLSALLRGEGGERRREFVRCEYYNALNMFAPDEPARNPPCHATMYFDGRYKLNLYHELDRGELYDLQSDPGEFHNLWNQPDFLPLREELTRKSFNASVVVQDPGPRLTGCY
jgi:arylsulfatase A-like enzyme